jgi:hypothetical protein
MYQLEHRVDNQEYCGDERQYLGCQHEPRPVAQAAARLIVAGSYSTLSVIRIVIFHCVAS